MQKLAALDAAEKKLWRILRMFLWIARTISNNIKEHHQEGEKDNPQNGEKYWQII